MNILDLHEIKRLEEMGWSCRKIARLFGVSKETIRVKLNPLAREQARERTRRKDKRDREAIKGICITSLNLRLGFGARPSDDILRQRDERLSAPFRDLTGALLGDPRRGASALDQKQQARAA